MVGAARRRRRSRRRRASARRARPRMRAGAPIRARSGPGRRRRRRLDASRSQSSIQNASRSRKSAISDALTGARGIRQQAGPGGERRARLVRRAVAVRRPERQHLPPGLAGRRQPVDESVGLAAQPAAGQRGDVQLDAAGAGKLVSRRSRRRCSGRSFHTRGVYPIRGYLDRPAQSLPDGPSRPPAAPRSDDPVPASRPSTAGATRQARASATRSASRPTSSGTATSCCARWPATAAPGSRRWSEAELRGSTPTSAACAGPASSRSTRIGRWEYTIEAWTDCFGTWRDELDRKVAAGQHDLGGELSEGVVLLREAAERARTRRATAGADRATRSAALEDENVPDEREARRRARTPSCSTPSSASRSATRPRRSAEPLPIEVDRLRARFGSWYELFPRSWGGLKGVEAQLPRLAELGFDVVYLPPIHPIGHDQPQGPRQRADRGTRRSGLAVGDRRRDGRPRRRPPRARHDR